MARPPSDGWNALVRAIEEECWAHRQNPAGGVLESDEAILKLSLLLGVDGGRFARTFTEREVLEGDPEALAAEFYTYYRHEQDRE